MKKIYGFFIILLGIIFILISIMGLVRAFDAFTQLGSSTENIVRTLGSIVFPLLLTVTGRWLFRKGLVLWKNKTPNR